MLLSGGKSIIDMRGKGMSNYSKVLAFNLLLCLTLLVLTSCTSTIIDLYHEDTNLITVEEGFDFSDPTLEKYQINNILFIPYFSQEFSNDKIYTLNMLVNKEAINDSKVVVNSIIVEGTKNVDIEKSEVILNKKLVFEELEGTIQESEDNLIEQINNKDMKLNENSEIKILINISVEENKKITTRNLEYIFITDVRTYLNQR
jgi:hypothetical protein